MKRVTFLIDDKTYEALRLQAFNERRKMSDLIRDGLEAIVNAPIAKPQHGGDRHKSADKATEAPGRPVDTPKPVERPVAAQSTNNGWHGRAGTETELTRERRRRTIVGREKDCIRLDYGDR